MKKLQLSFPVESLALSVRARTILRRACIKTVGDLLAKSEDEILGFSGKIMKEL